MGTMMMTSLLMNFMNKSKQGTNIYGIIDARRDCSNINKTKNLSSQTKFYPNHMDNHF